MASLPLSFQLFYDGVWNVLNGYAQEGWETQVGPDADSGLQPNKIDFTLASDNLVMDPTYAPGSLYGKIGRNTPARVQISATTLTWGEASSWKPERTPEHVPGVRGRSWVGITAEGVLRRLGRWDDPIDSPLRRQISGYASLLGYWPLEDPTGSARLAQLVPTVEAGTYSGTVSLAGDPGAGGSDSVLTVSASSTVFGAFRSPSGNGYQISFAVRLNVLPGSGTYGTIFAYTDSAGRTYSWQVNNVSYRTVVQDADGTVLDSSVIAAQPILAWARMRIKVTVSGSTVTYEPAWYTQDDTTGPSGITATFSGTTTGRPRTWVIPGNAYTDGAAYGHVFAVTDTSLDIVGTTSDARLAFDGYKGERAGWRFYRLLGEVGITRYVVGATTSAPMGRQKPGRIIDLLAECAATEAAVVYDEPLDIAVTMRCFTDLINRTAALALTVGTDVGVPLQKDITDTGVVNDITVANRDGTEVRLQRTSGRLSISPPPAGVGAYKKSVDVNLSDPTRALTNRAEFALAEGTVDRARYRQVRIDLLANPSLRAACTALRPGDFITITGAEPDTIWLRVLTINRAGGAVEDSCTLTTVPADPYITGVYDATARRQDSASTTLAAGATSSATSLSLTTANQFDVWSTTSLPYDMIIAGERVRVTAMTAAAGTAGVGPFTQTATVTRSINGVVKAQLVNAEVRTFDPARYAYGGL
jgi:hypothetical protein